MDRQRRLEYDPTDAAPEYHDRCQDGLCRLRATAHLLIDEPYPGKPEGTHSFAQWCDGHARAWRRRLGTLVIEEHAFRKGGMPCGIEGSEWVEGDNRCHMPEDYENPELAGIAEIMGVAA